jgi:hypothetical protein
MGVVRRRSAMQPRLWKMPTRSTDRLLLPFARRSWLDFALKRLYSFFIAGNWLVSSAVAYEFTWGHRNGQGDRLSRPIRTR